MNVDPSSGSRPLMTTVSSVPGPIEFLGGSSVNPDPEGVRVSMFARAGLRKCCSARFYNYLVYC